MPHFDSLWGWWTDLNKVSQGRTTPLSDGDILQHQVIQLTLRAVLQKKIKFLFRWLCNSFQIHKWLGKEKKLA
jgi:hypothetical protein